MTSGSVGVQWISVPLKMLTGNVWLVFCGIFQCTAMARTVYKLPNRTENLCFVRAIEFALHMLGKTNHTLPVSIFNGTEIHCND